MKYDINATSDIDVISTTHENEITLSEDSKSIIFQMFSKNIYSNPIGSLVREITSNCFDSHVEANVNQPVLIRKNIDNKTNTTTISFIDFGVGMSPERMKNVFAVMFSSTKRNTNNQMGCFGLGSKVPLAYKRSTGFGLAEYDNAYHIITNFDGIKYVYQIYEKDNMPMYSEMHQEPTTDRNGTEVQIPVLEKDIDKFVKEMVRQLYYFENVIFEGFENPDEYDSYTELSNDYQIIKGKSFLYRGTDYSGTIHVCLGRVAYPIDYTILGLSSSDYRLPIALKLDIGDINVTVSRESLDYSESTIKMLKKKLNVAKNEIIKLISKQYKNIVTLKEYFNVTNSIGTLKFTSNVSMEYGNLIGLSDLNFSKFKYFGLTIPSDKQIFSLFFNTKTYGIKPKQRRYYYNNDFEVTYDILVNADNILYVDDDFNRKNIKQAYLKDEFNTFYVVNQKNIDNKHSRKDIINIFTNVVTDDDNVMLRLLEMQKDYMDIVRNNTENYETLVVPQDFINKRKINNGLTDELRKKTIPLKFVEGYGRTRIELSVLFDYKTPIFYGTMKDYPVLKEMRDTYGLLFGTSNIVTHYDYNNVLCNSDDNNKNSILFIQISKPNIEHMKHCKNANHIDTFYWKMLHRKQKMVANFFQTHDISERFNSLDDFYRKGFINKVNENWGRKVDEIKKFIHSIPNKNERIGYRKTQMFRIFKIDNITKTKEQVNILKYVQDIQTIEANNNNVLNYFNMPWRSSQLDDEQAMLIDLAMNFKI